MKSEYPLLPPHPCPSPDGEGILQENSTCRAGDGVDVLITATPEVQR
jgi:hypothetical protein